MNFIEHYFEQPLTIVRSENKQGYIESLLLSKDTKDLSPFLHFMANEHLNHLKAEIKLYKSQFNDEQQARQTDKGSGKGYSLVF